MAAFSQGVALGYLISPFQGECRRTQGFPLLLPLCGKSSKFCLEIRISWHLLQNYIKNLLELHLDQQGI
jgi:hypothetical protein